MKYFAPSETNTPRSATKNQAGGFTLVEMLIAIGILLVAVVGPMVLMSGGTTTIQTSKDRIIASFLAEEAIEYIMAKKRQNAIDLQGGENAGDINYSDYGSPLVEDWHVGRDMPEWLKGFGPCGNENGCYFDVSGPIDGDGNIASPCVGGECPLIEYCQTDNFYGYSNSNPGIDCDGEWEDTKFRRTVKLEEVELHEYRVVVEVDWLDPRSDQDQLFELRTNVFHTTF